MWLIQSFLRRKRRSVATLTLLLALLAMLLPGAALAAPAQAPTVAPSAHGSGSNCVDFHIVRRGQSLFGIARYYGVNPHELARANGIRNWNLIYVGQKLCIPGGYTPPPPPPPPPSTEPPKPDELVTRLATGTHPVEVGLRPEKTAQAFKDAIDRGYVHIKFTKTKGGTELGVRLDPKTSDWSQADFSQATGSVHVEGTLTLNYVKVRCLADINLSTLTGTGNLVILED